MEEGSIKKNYAYAYAAVVVAAATSASACKSELATYTVNSFIIL